MDIGGGTSLGLEGEEGTDIGAAAAAVWLRTGHELGFGETEGALSLAPSAMQS